MADIYLRGKTWWGRVQKNGQDIRSSLQTRSQSVARERLKVWLDELEASGWGAKPRLTLNAVMDAFQIEHGPSLRPKTLKRYGISIDWLDAFFGDKLLLALRPADLKDFETDRRSKGASAPTVRRDLATLSTIFSFAIEKEWADSNPVTAFIKQRSKRGLRENEPRRRYLTRAEETKLLANAMPYVRDAMVFAIYSGLRTEEQFSLTWDRVNLDNREVVIPKTIAKAKRDRTVILLDEAIDVLRRTPRHMRSAYVFHHGLAVKAAGAQQVRLVRPTRAAKDGDRFVHLLRGLKEAARRAGIKDLRWHDLRRTHGCRLLQEHGWSLEMVKDQLGHQSVVQTEKAYAFLEVESRRAAASRTKVGTG